METLDSKFIVTITSRPNFGWRWGLVSAYLLLFVWGAGFLAYSAANPTGCLVGESTFPEASYTETFGASAIIAGAILFIFRMQAGWVFATVLSSAVLVLLAIGTLAGLIPGFLPIDTGWMPILVGAFLTVLAGCIFSLVSSRKLRASFRIPRSWVGRCVTLGGMIGTAAGLYLIWLVR